MNDAEFDKRANETPDQYTLAWWKRQFAEVTTGYRGANHSLNRVYALYEDLLATNAELRRRIDSMELERDKDRAKIGELQARVERIAT